MKLGIIGLPNVGKSMLFNSLTRAGAESVNYPFSTVHPNVGVVHVPDPRLKELAKIYKTEKIIPAVIEFVDIAGLVKGSNKGEGLGNRFLSHIREVDALVHVVRCFDDPNVVHVNDVIDPPMDIETINFELIFADLETIERRLAKGVKAARSDKAVQREVDILTMLQTELEKGIRAQLIPIEDEETRQIVEELNLLSYKPVLYAANIMEDDMMDDGSSNEYVEQVRKVAADGNAEVFVVCAQIEAELSSLDDEERDMFLRDLGVMESGQDKLIAASYKLLGLTSFLTAGPKEVRAWTIQQGTKAVKAAGKIHSDLERGFIRAEIVNYDDLVRLGNYTTAKENGLVRLEGKEYVMREGDVVLFRFNV